MMDDTTYKPLDYDPNIFVNTEKVVEDLLAQHGDEITSVEQLPLSCFSNYTAKKDNLNIFQQKKGVEKYIGNDLVFLSGGDTQSQYITGVGVSKQEPQRNLLNIFNPTCNFIPEKQRKTYDQIGGFFTPDKIGVVTYASYNPAPRILQDRITPGVTYMLPDINVYGSGYGNNKYGVNLPIDHKESTSWVKPPWVNIGMRGRIFGVSKMPLFYNYTSTETTLDAPKYGISKYTDNYDFWYGSAAAEVWANPDVYELKEANKYYITQRAYELLTDLCDSPYKWRTDVFGNQYMLYKPATFLPPRIYGGSDTDGDGIDDKIGAQDPDSKPESDINDGSPDGVNPGGPGEGKPGDDGPPPPKKTDPETGEEIDDDDEDDQKEGDNAVSQKSVRECKYWLYGGDSFDPNDEESMLDIAITHGANTTIVGTVSTIIDGGWRPLRMGTDSSYTSSSNHWPIDDSAAEDQTENAFQTISSGSTYGATYTNGFFDQGMWTHQVITNAPFDSLSAEAKWMPDYTASGEEVVKMTLVQDINPTVPDKFTNVFNTIPSRARGVGDEVYRWTGRTETGALVSSKTTITDFTYKVADGGWTDPVPHNEDRITFRRVECDRASYIVSLYGADGRPDFGDHIFACRIWDITDDPEKYLDTQEVFDFVMSRKFPSGTEKKREKDSRAYIQKQINNALIRGPMNALHFRNPIEFIEEGFTEANPQFFGKKNSMLDWLLANEKISQNVHAQHYGKPTRFPGHNYLEELEYMFMRLSPIEGTGVGTINIDDLSFSLYAPVLDEDSGEPTGLYEDTAQFINLTGVDDEGSKSLDYYSKGDPDMFYYHGNPQDGVQQTPGLYFRRDEFGNTTAAVVLYSATSGQCSYIDNYNTAESIEQRGIDDLAGTAPQFPNVYFINDARKELLTLQEYNDNINCATTAEFRYVGSSGPLIDVTIPPSHPYAKYHNMPMAHKRGYWPPPVGQLRREIIDYDVKQADGSNFLVRDNPIKNNLMPEQLVDENGVPQVDQFGNPVLESFYLHDIWDGSGFGGHFGALLDQTWTPPPGSNEGEPELGDNDGTIGDTNETKCWESKTEEQKIGVIEYRAIEIDGELLCIPQCDLDNDYVISSDGTHCVYDPDAAQKEREKRGGGGGGGEGDAPPCTSSKCTNLDGSTIRFSCGDREGFRKKPGAEVPSSPCYSDDIIPPFQELSYFRKFYSDLGDWCTMEDLPTLWDQKNKALKFSEGRSTSFFRNIKNNISDLSDSFGTLISKYESVNVSHHNVLTTNCKLIDFDVIYDTLILRHSNQDPRAGNEYASESLVLDTITYDYDSGQIDFTGSDLKFIKTQQHSQSQLLSHFFNERDNTILTGRTYFPETEYDPSMVGKIVVPEIYELDISKNKFDKVYPTNNDQFVEYELPSDIVSAGYEVHSVDPGDISYNADTNHYSVTYMMYLYKPADASYDPYPVICNMVLTKHAGVYKVLDNTLYTGDLSNTNTTTEVDGTDKVSIRLDKDNQSPETIAINAFEVDVELDLAGIDTRALRLEIDWGDGEIVDVQSDFSSAIPRYTGDYVWIGTYTRLEPGDSNGSPNSRDNTSLSRHKVTHLYRSAGDGNNYTINITSMHSDGTTSYTKSIEVTTSLYSVNQVTDNKGIKILNTKLFTNAIGKENLLLTLETQGEKRYVGTNILQLS